MSAKCETAEPILTSQRARTAIDRGAQMPSPALTMFAPFSRSFLRIVLIGCFVLLAVLLAAARAAADPPTLTQQGSVAIPAGATFAVALPNGGFAAGGPNGLQDYDANAQPVGSVYGASQLGGNTITNGLLSGGNQLVFGYQPG